MTLAQVLITYHSMPSLLLRYSVDTFYAPPRNGSVTTTRLAQAPLVWQLVTHSYNERTESDPQDSVCLRSMPPTASDRTRATVCSGNCPELLLYQD
jgi:hypothetical protein